MSRLQKYNSQKKKKLVLISKIVVVFYLVIFSFSYLTGGTIAYFGNSSQSTVNLTAGTWFDGSKLVFVGNGTQVEKSCSAVEISAVFKNVGNRMQGTAKYEIYSTEPQSKGNGAPQKHGTLQFEGVIPALEKNEEITLTYEAAQEGDYVFKVYQREGFDSNEQKEIWSNKIKIQCKENNGNNKQNSEEKEQDTTTSEEEADNDSQKKGTVNEEKEVVEESTDEPVESDTSQQDPTEDENNQSNEQNENAAEDVPEEENAKEETSEEGATNTNNQPDGEGETNEETD